MAKNLLIKNCRILNPSSKEIKESDISLENGVIAKIEKVKKVYPFAEVLDAEGRIVAPGFIDLHIQGAGGADVLDGRRESLEMNLLYLNNLTRVGRFHLTEHNLQRIPG